MAVSMSRNVIENIKDELRKQVRLWNYQLVQDTEMSECSKSSLEKTLEKTKIIQKIRLGHVEKLLDKLETGNKYSEEIVNEIQAYWTVILPDIRNVLDTFHQLNVERKSGEEIEKFEIPEKLNLPIEICRAPQLTSESTHDKNATQSISRRKSTYSSFSTVTTVTDRSRTRAQEKSKVVKRR